ncbi:hypothetical protein COJ48_14830 [Bacillus cereus]|nr:hypothetical protein COJ48_14830 [Bacillus cereus]PGP88780.1 hypothetical protein CN997_01940 [Bacillus cereus]
MNMGNKKRDIIIFIVIVITIIILAIGCTTAFIHNRNITKERAAKAAMQYIKKEEGVDVIVTEVDVKSAFQGGFIEVRGYAKDDKKRTFYVTISKKQNYSIMGWNLDAPN